MRKRYHSISLLLFIFVLSFLYYKSRVLDTIRAENIFGSFRNIKQSDSLLDENILKSRYYLNKNYDPINESLQNIQSEINFLDKGDDSLRKSGDSNLITNLDEYIKVYNEKKSLIDTFKSQNAILKNALYLLPISTEKVKSLKLYNSAFLDESLKNILIFNLTGEEDLKIKCEESLEILKLAAPQIQNIEFDILIKHTENILQKKMSLDKILNEILRIRTAETLELLSREFSTYYNSFLNNANIYRLLTYAFSVMLIVYIGFILVNLLISSISINIANSNLKSLNHTFEKFVPKESIGLLSKKSLSELRLGDNVKKKMTVLFSDIRSFTTLSEKMTPEENFSFINSYLGAMGPVIRRNNGFIDKYIGDAIMAIFEKEEEALQAGVEMLETLNIYNEKNRNSVTRPPIKIGIGIHTGSMMFGTVGEQHRMDSTVISDAVNLASRIESTTKLYGVNLLISEDIYNSLTNKDQFKIRYIDKITVKGKNIPIKVYEVFNCDTSDIIELKEKIKPMYEKCLDLFDSQNFSDCATILEEAVTIYSEDIPIQKLQQKNLERLLKTANSEFDAEFAISLEMDT
jgi:class 3 adenylate cyclase/type III secretory pathway component EscR